MFGDPLLFTPEELEDQVLAMQEVLARLEEDVIDLQMQIDEQNKTPNK